MGGIRTFSNISQVFAAKALNYKFFEGIFHTIISIIAIAGTIFSFRLGLLISTVADIVESLKDIAVLLKQKQYKKAFNELLTLLSSSLFLAIILYGSLELTIASLIIKGCICLYQAREELLKDKIPEAIAKIAMSCIRFKSAHDNIKILNKINTFIKFLSKSPVIEPINEKGDFFIVDGGKALETAKKLDGIGNLIKKEKGYVYLNVSDEFVDLVVDDLPLNGTFKAVTEKKNGIGAHISVFYEKETTDNNLDLSSDLDCPFKFEVEDLRYIIRSNKPHMITRLWMFGVHSPELQMLRSKFNLSNKLNNHDFHITLGTEKEKIS